MSEIQINTSIMNNTFPDLEGQQVEKKISFRKGKH